MLKENFVSHIKTPVYAKFLTFLAMLQISIMLSCHVLVYKLVSVFGVTASASTFLFPLTYFLADVIAEVYGYKISRQLIWAVFACMFFFDIVPAMLVNLPAPVSWNHQAEYNTVLGNLPRIFMADFIAINLGQFINIYGITKLKVLTKGRFFILRSIFSSIIGETVFTLIVFFVVFSGVNDFSTIIEMMIFSYVFKVFCAIVLSYPASLLCSYLKTKEGVDVYDYNTNFNPFRLSTE